MDQTLCHVLVNSIQSWYILMTKRLIHIHFQSGEDTRLHQLEKFHQSVQQDMRWAWQEVPPLRYCCYIWLIRNKEKSADNRAVIRVDGGSKKMCFDTSFLTARSFRLTSNGPSHCQHKLVLMGVVVLSLTLLLFIQRRDKALESLSSYSKEGLQLPLKCAQAHTHNPAALTSAVTNTVRSCLSDQQNMGPI